ncbi:hypothetical protein [Kitasatospora sp. NPDC098663]|uniref:hypothetical protein n=1 Tax=Kitasatospora sp. NPDC098663 TaxID=3364096 RepID=UPI0037F75364
MPNDTLVVPVEVAAFAVNAQTRDTDGSYVMQRWIANFVPFVNDNAAPEPAPFAGAQMWTGDPSRLGVYLQWQLPEGLCQGRQDRESGEIGDFPLVPNRWLVVRRSDAGVRSWIVQSDYLDRSTGTVSYLDPTAATATATKIGRHVELTDSAPWHEPADAPAPFLTAIGPGLLTFSVYQPYNTNVFSLHDTLEDITGDDRLSYWVAGWYADPTSDILAPDAGDFDELLHDLEWSLAPGMGSPRRSLYTGSALGIAWHPEGGIPESDSPLASSIAVAIGNSTGEAAAVLQEQTGGPGSLSSEDARRYAAFTLGVLENFERPDGDLFPERAAHDSGFGPVPGGHSWRVVERDTESARLALGPAERTRAALLAQDVTAQLNRTQRELDSLERELYGAQQHLYVLWALSQEKKQPDVFTSRIRRELDHEYAEGAAGRTKALAAQVTVARTRIPWSTQEEDLAQQARDYATAHGLRVDQVLQRVPNDPFEQSTDPVLMLQGAKLNAPMTRDSKLPCRVEESLVIRIGSITATTVAADVAKVNTVGLPALLPKLATEFFILDQARKTGASLDDADGRLPDHGTEPWRQPWQPLYLLWEAEYTAIPFQEDGAELWTFDGHRYRWDGQGTLPVPRTVGGRQILTPTSGYDQEGQIEHYAAGRADLPEDLIRRLRQEARELDQLSQRLDGLSTAIGQRMAGGSAIPTGDLGDLIASGTGPVPDPGGQPVNDWDDWDDVDLVAFQELRSGHLMFTKLSVVDRFGRAVNLIDNPLHFNRLIKPDSMTPDHAVGEIQTDRYAELGPRLLQPARLAFDFLSSAGDEDVKLTPGTNPVCAWLLHNRLDRSLACYDPDGQALGDLRTVLDATRERIVTWTALPGSQVQDLDQLAEISPHTHQLLATIQQRGPAVLDAVRTQLDDTLAAIDPDGPEDQSLAFLLGRPLALVRARLDLQLHGPARTDVAWRNVITPPEPTMPRYQWAVRLGEAQQVDDGLIGYVLGEDYDHLETVLAPRGDGHGGYLRPIDRGQRLKLAFEGDSSAAVTLLLDPRAPVHATTDILPVSSVTVPPQYTDAALANMAVNFRTGPMLIATTEHDAATLPQPTTATGTWSWTERVGADWVQLPITVPDPASLPIGEHPQIRTGFLVLQDATHATRTTTRNARGAR